MNDRTSPLRYRLEPDMSSFGGLQLLHGTNERQGFIFRLCSCVKGWKEKPTESATFSLKLKKFIKFAAFFLRT